MNTNILSISGGKDSTALLLLAIERGAENLQAVFADTGHEHQLTYDYVRYLEQATGVPIRWVRADFARQIEAKREYVKTKWAEKGVPQNVIDRALAALVPSGNPFLDLCIWKGRFPSTKARFCSEELKHNPINDQVVIPALDRFNEVRSWQGVRADESPSRARLEEEEDHPQRDGLVTYRPILKWTVDDVFAMHRKHGINPNPLYKLGMGRVGCMPCIHARKDELREIFARFPEVIDRIREWEAAVSAACKRQQSTFFSHDKTPGDHLADITLPMPGIDVVVEWSKTSRGGKQYDMLACSMDAPMCSSIYGLCE
jgi:3'-phosphoadenosine 5'-phosphosulfate sulfotransferase (PAPS reductase)/FAD synthetase